MTKNLAEMTWKTREGKTLKITEMESRHLFFSVRMIWNHRAPDELRIRPYKRYNLLAPANYLLPRLAAMLSELRRRIESGDTEIKKVWIDDLRFMFENCTKLRRTQKCHRLTKHEQGQQRKARLDQNPARKIESRT